MFRLEKIDHNKTGKRPLAVSFTAEDGASFIVDCSAAELTSFARFRNVIADRVGVWVIGDFAGRHGAEDWQAEIATAFAKMRDPLA